MEAIIWVAVIALGFAARFAYRSISVRKQQKVAFMRRVRSFYHEQIAPLPLGKLGFLCAWHRGNTRYENLVYIEMGPNDIFTAAYYYLKAVEDGRIYPRDFDQQSDLLGLVQWHIKPLYKMAELSHGPFVTGYTVKATRHRLDLKA